MIIYVITHKSYKKVTKSNLYQTLLVGADKNNSIENCVKDNDFPENISYKNPHFCELTGIYWIWKRSQEDYVGICHYRRYFSTSKYLKKTHILTKKKAAKLLRKYDVILPLRNEDTFEGLNAKEQFARFHDDKVWDICKNIIKNNYSNYLKDFVWFEEQLSGYCYNMMMTSKKIFNQYCEWLFPILFELEKQIDINQYDSYNQRMFGFVSERLLNVWIHHHSFKIKELPIYFAEDLSLEQKIHRKLKKIFSK
jgi:hypothetical protein